MSSTSASASACRFPRRTDPKLPPWPACTSAEFRGPLRCKSNGQLSKPRAQPARGFFVAIGTEKRLAMPSTVLVAGGCPHWGGPGWRLHSARAPYAILIKIIKISCYCMMIVINTVSIPRPLRPDETVRTPGGRQNLRSPSPSDANGCATGSTKN